MAIVDDSMNGDSVNSNTGEDVPSPSDLAWVDSLLNYDLVASDTDWSPIIDALSDIPSFQSEPLHPVAAENYTPPSINEDFNFNDYVASLTFTRGGSDDDEDLTDADSEDVESSESSDDDEGNPMTTNKRAGTRGKKRIQNVFRPHYTEDIVNIETSDTISGMEDLIADMGDAIFKVWDLGISEEQDVFTEQLEKVLSDFPASVQENPDDSSVSKDEMHVSVDDLVAGMGDLSLKRTAT